MARPKSSSKGITVSIMENIEELEHDKISLPSKFDDPFS